MAKTRLDILKEEREIVRNLRCMTFDMQEKALERYDHEIKCIEEFGSMNPVVEE